MQITILAKSEDSLSSLVKNLLIKLVWLGTAVALSIYLTSLYVKVAPIIMDYL